MSSQGTVACSGGAQAAGLAFEGIRNDVPVAELESLAFEPLFSTPYNTTIEGVDRVTQACNLGEWVVACRQNGAATYTVAATGLKTEILTDLGNRLITPFTTTMASTGISVNHLHGLC